MSISTITIAGVDYVSYASVAEADAYLNADFTRDPSWEIISTENKGKHLITATRRLNILNWQGLKAGGADAQADAWPRINVTYKDGTPVTTVDVPQEVEAATILMAHTIATNSAASQAGSSGNNNIKRLQAGSANLEYFRPGVGVPLQDETAYALIKQFLTSGLSDAIGPNRYGEDAQSSFADDQMGYGLREGYS